MVANCQLSTVNCQNQLPIANHPTYQLDEPLKKVLPADLITITDNFRLLQQKSTHVLSYLCRLPSHALATLEYMSSHKSG